MNQEFKNYLKEQEVQPPFDVWENIEKELDEKSKKRRFSIMPMLASVAFMGIMASIITVVLISNPVTSNSFTNKLEKNPTENNHTPQAQTEFKNNIETNQSSDANIYDDTLKPNKSEKTNTSSPKIPHSNKNVQVTTSYSSSKENQNENIVSNSQAVIEDESISSSPQNNSNIISIPIQPIAEEETVYVEIRDSIPNQTSFCDTDLMVDSKEPELGASKKTTSKWEVMGYIAPSYTRSASEENIWLIDLNEYAGKYENATNFGVKVQYHINDKWSVRMGVGSTSLKQQAHDVIYTYQDMDEHSSDINFRNNITILRTSDFINNPISYDLMNKGDIHQSINYISIPLEVGYSVYNSSSVELGLFVGSVSNILTEDYIELHQENSKQNIGHAKNLNTFVMSSQLGLQTRFKITPKIGFIFDPEFIYFFNTFNQNNKVRPYTINLNTGFSIGF